MIEFSRILLEPVKDKTARRQSQFRLCLPLQVKIQDSYVCSIESGFISDGASIPSFARWKWSSWGKYSGPALMHDYLLKHSDRPKWEIDTLFYIALRSCEVSALEAAIFWMAVRLKRTKN